MIALSVVAPVVVAVAVAAVVVVIADTRQDTHGAVEVMVSSAGTLPFGTNTDAVINTATATGSTTHTTSTTTFTMVR